MCSNVFFSISTDNIIKMNHDRDQHVYVDLSPKDKIIVHLTELYKTIKPGDHLAVPILSTPHTHRAWHHGIYAGDEHGKAMVLHMHGDDKFTAIICQDSLVNFCGNATHVAIVQYSDDSGREQALQTAQGLRVRNAGEVYDLLNNNCEHFAVYCWTGRCVSMNTIDSELTSQYKLIPLRSYDKAWSISTFKKT